MLFCIFIFFYIFLCILWGFGKGTKRPLFNWSALFTATPYLSSSIKHLVENKFSAHTIFCSSLRLNQSVLFLCSLLHWDCSCQGHYSRYCWFSVQIFLGLFYLSLCPFSLLCVLLLLMACTWTLFRGLPSGYLTALLSGTECQKCLVDLKWLNVVGVWKPSCLTLFWQKPWM